MRTDLVCPALACLALAAIGCPDRSLQAVGPVAARAVTKDIPVDANLDVLFVIDDSRSTLDKQKVFAQNYKNFVTALAGFPGGLPNVHLGVVTSSVDVDADVNSGVCHPAAGTNGALQHAARDSHAMCAPPTDDAFLSDLALPGGARQVNYTGALADALSCISSVGDTGCGLEAPLEAMRRALDGSHPENAGFVRPGALLAVVILTDEDDCSADPALFSRPPVAGDSRDFTCAQDAYACEPSISAPGAHRDCRVRHDGLLHDPRDYAEFLTTLKGPGGVAVAVIGGDPMTEIATGPLTKPFTQSFTVQPSCSATINGTFAIGRPGLRLDEFRGVFAERGLFRSVCQSDYTGALTDIGNLLIQALRPCLEGTLDTTDRQPGAPGLQPDCTVSEIQDPNTDRQVDTLIAPCGMRAAGQPDLGDAPACWWVQVDPTCSTQTQLALRIERTAAPPPGSLIRVSCAIAD
jgi:hypothetical protein